MSKEKLFSSYRWNDVPVTGKIKKGKEQSKEERIKSKKALLEILVKNKTINQEEADRKLEDFINNYK